MFDKEYFLTQLRKGADLDDMGKALATALNEAQKAYAEEQAAKEKEAKAAAMAQTKRELVLDMVGIIQAYGRLVAPEAAETLEDITDDDIDAMIAGLDQMYQMMRSMAQLKTDLEKITITQIPECKPVTKRAKSDDEILANFIKTLS